MGGKRDLEGREEAGKKEEERQETLWGKDVVGRIVVGQKMTVFCDGGLRGQADETQINYLLGKIR